MAMLLCATLAVSGTAISAAAEKTSDEASSETRIIGDVDNDGGVSAGDSLKALRASVKIEKLDDVSKLLTLKDIPFIAANPDYVCPTEYGFVPDCGSVCGMLKNATGKEPYYIGKPRPEMVYFAVDRIHKKDTGVCIDNTMVVGDRMYTDIASGINAKAKTCLVLSGETTEEQAYNNDYKIDYILRDGGRILEELKRGAV